MKNRCASSQAVPFLDRILCRVKLSLSLGLSQRRACHAFSPRAFSPLALCLLSLCLIGLQATASWAQEGPPAAVTMGVITQGQDYYYGTPVAQLSWSQNDDNDFQEYRLYRATQAGITVQNATLITSITAQGTTQYEDNATATPAPGTTYYYRIFVVDQDGLSSGSNERSIIMLDAAPTAATLSPITTGQGYYGPAVQLSWTRNGDGDFDEYRLYRATHATVTEQDTLVATIDHYYSYGDPITYEDSPQATPPPGTTYYYRVFSIDQAGQSTPSNERSITLVDNPPAALTLNPISVGQGYESSGPAAQLSWGQGSDSDLAQYRLYRATQPGVTQQHTLVTTIQRYDAYSDPVQYSDAAPATPPPGTTYYYRVFAVDQAGQATGSNEESVLMVNSPPTAVTLHPITSGQGYYGVPAAELSWTQSSDNDFQEYRLYRATHADVTPQDTLAGTFSYQSYTTYTDDAPATPAPGTTYYYRVFVIDQAGQAVASNEESVTLVDSAPAAVTLNPITLQPSYDGGYAQLSWSTSQAADLHQYRLYRATHAGVTEQDTLIATIEPGYWYGDPITVTDSPQATLPPGTTYYYKVFVIDRGGQSSGSNEESITMIAPPEAPGTPNFSNIRRTSITATLPALPPGASSLTLQKKLGSQSDESYADVATEQVGNAVIEVTGLNGSTDYTFRCIAVGAGGSTVGPAIGVTTDWELPSPPGVPTFSNWTMESVTVTAPAPPLPAYTTWLTLQGKLAGADDLEYVDIAVELDAGESTVVSDLSTDTTYTFRYIAVGPGGETAGPAVDVATPSATGSWQAGSAIDCGGIRWPLAGGTIVAGSQGLLSSYLATDWDQRDYSVGDIVVQSKLYTDPCTYTWSASGGSFKNGVNRGNAVTWIAPTQPGPYTLTLVVDDQGGANKPLNEEGSRNDAERGYNDEPLKFSVSITVQ